MQVFANAKINLGLNVVGRRNDGFHEIESIFLPIDLVDEIIISPSKKDSFYSNHAHLPLDVHQNLCFKALQLLRKDFNFPNVHLELKKNIPIGAGLGGGSADAAFVLKEINRQFNLEITPLQLESYAAQLGSDCIFFIQNKAALIAGRGEKVTVDPAYNVLKGYHLLLVKPDVFVSTRKAYAQLVPQPPKQSIATLIQQPIDSWKKYIKNDFEETIFKIHPILEEVKNQLYSLGAVYSSMSGSGSTVYGVFESKIDVSTFNTYWWKWAKTL